MIPARRLVGWLFATALLAPVSAAASARALAADVLETAKEQGRIAIVLVTDAGAAGVEEAEKTVAAAASRHGNAVTLTLDRARPENAALVSRYRLSGPQIPVVLVFATNGLVAGGALAAGLTVDRLMSMIPTAREESIIAALQSGKGVLVLVCPKGAGAGALKACRDAREKSGRKLAIVEVDSSDPAELPLLRKLRVDPASKSPVTVVINSRGQSTGVFPGVPDAGLLVQAGAKTAGGCCPAGAKPGAVCSPK